jgi:hypothetical protein
MNHSTGDNPMVSRNQTGMMILFCSLEKTVMPATWEKEILPSGKKNGYFLPFGNEIPIFLNFTRK